MPQSIQSEIFIHTLTQMRDEDRMYQDAMKRLRVVALTKRFMQRFRTGMSNRRYPARTLPHSNHAAFEAIKRIRDE